MRNNLGDVGLLHITRTEVSPLNNNNNKPFFFLVFVILVISTLVHRYICKLYAALHIHFAFAIWFPIL